MVDPFQIATNGVGPGWSTFHMASMGFGFEIEIQITPVQGGGGWYEDHPREYVVLVRVKYKGKVWEQKKTTNQLTAKTLEKVLASFKYVSSRVVNVSSSFINTMRRKVSVFAKINSSNKLGANDENQS
jgi:hypothetical protein